MPASPVSNAAADKRLLRVLVLHGHAMSAELMRSKLGFLRSETKKICEWFFLDGPVECPSISESLANDDPAVPTATATDAPTAKLASARTWYDFTGETTVLLHGAERADLEALWADELAAVAAKQATRNEMSEQAPTELRLPTYAGVDAALRHVDSFCASNGPFDGIFGFSQGAVVAALWLARQRRRREEDLHQQRAGMGFAVLVSGLLPRDPKHRSELLSITPPSVQPLRSLHCYGTTDGVILPQQSLALAHAPLFGTAPARAVVTHDGGHVVASSLRKPIKAFLSEVRDEIRRAD